MNNGILAIRRGLVYEGDLYVLRAIHPIPVITTARCEFTEPMPGNPQGIVFREDSFDPVARIRRGRFYRENGDLHQLSPDHVHNYPFGPHVGVRGGSWDADSRYVVVEHVPPGIQLEKSRVVLGSGDFETLWRVVGAEKTSIGHLLFTLRALSSLGMLPMLANKIKSHGGDAVDSLPIQDTLEHIVKTFHVQQPIQIIDVCRESARVILAAWIGSSADTKDLGKVIARIPEGKEIIRQAAFVINRLHPRGKSAEHEQQAAKGLKLRHLVDEDAETSVHLIGLILRDIGWAAP